MANRRCVHVLARYLSSTKALNPFCEALAPTATHVVRRNLTSFPNRHILAGNCANDYSQSALFPRHFSSKNSDSEEGEDEGDESEDDEEAEAETEVVLSKDEKVKEASEIGYSVIGPLQDSDRVFKPYEPVFAVVQIGSHQFKVSNGDCIYTEKLKYCDINDKLILNKVLMLGSSTQTIIGRPILPDAAVHAVVEEHALDAKVIIFKKKRRKNYRRTKGHRQVVRDISDSIVSSFVNAIDLSLPSRILAIIPQPLFQELTKLRITDIQGIEKPVIEKTLHKAPPLKTEKKTKPSVAA